MPVENYTNWNNKQTYTVLQKKYTTQPPTRILAVVDWFQ